MTKIEKKTTIQASVKDVWDYLDDPTNLLEIWPSMHEVKNVQRQANGGQSYDWTYRMAGVPFHGHSEPVEVEPQRLFVTTSKSGIASTFRWTFEGAGGETTLTLEVEYEIPGKVMERLAAPFIRRVNEREAETVLENLKGRLETETRSRAATPPTEARP